MRVGSCGSEDHGRTPTYPHYHHHQQHQNIIHYLKKMFCPADKNQLDLNIGHFLAVFSSPNCTAFNYFLHCGRGCGKAKVAAQPVIGAMLLLPKFAHCTLFFGRQQRPCFSFVCKNYTWAAVTLIFDAKSQEVPPGQWIWYTIDFGLWKICYVTHSDLII